MQGNVANLITLARTLLAFVVAAMLHVRTSGIYLTAVVLTVAVILMDALDGWVARRLRESSTFGAVADILGDRVIEMTYWILFAAFGWVPAWVAILVAARVTLVDGFRAIALQRGFTAFGATSMQQSPLGRFLVASRVSRAAYGVGKALAFSLVILAFTPGLQPPFAAPLRWLAYASVYGTLALCLLRGGPVLAEARRLV